MKKGMKIFTTAVAIGLSLTALVGTAVLSNTIRSLASDLPSTMECSYFFDETNGYTSIYEINNDLFNDNVKSTYKTWGTITESWVYNGITSTYIQSTDKDGHPAAICLYNCNTPKNAYPNGSVLEVVFSGSNLTIYNNMPEVNGGAVVTKLYFDNPSPVVTEDVTFIWQYGDGMDSQYYQTLAPFGPVRERIYNCSLTSVSNREATVTLSSGKTAKLYYANVGASGSTSTQIKNRLTDFFSDGESITVYGYVNPFKNSAGTSGNLQLLLRNVFDILPASFSNDSAVLQEVEVSGATTTTFNLGQQFASPWLNVTMRDGTHTLVNDSPCTGYDMSSIGTYYVTINFIYSFGGKNTTFALADAYSINVVDSGSGELYPTLLEVWGDKKTEYTVGDSFEVPTYVYVDYSDGSWSNVPNECTYTGYDLNTPGTYTVLVSYTYNGVTVTDSYTITVTASGQEKEPSYIQVLYATTEYNVGDAFDTPSVALYYTDGSTKNISYDCLYEGYDMNTPGTYTVEVTYFEGNFVDYTTYTITVTGDPVDPNAITFDTSLTSGNYSTGNYGTKSSNGYEFIYYRTTDFDDGVANLLPAVCNYGDPMGGSIANTTPIQGIDSVTIKYSNTSKSGATAGKLSYGATNTLDGSLSIPYSTSDNTVTLNIPGGANFIKIESGNTKLALKEFTVHYTNSGSSYYTPINAYTNNYRVNPNKYTGTLVAGSTSVTVPTSVSYSGNRYTVLQSKTYTYYTLDYVESHPSVASAAAMTDPVDVANYFSIFGTVPANYGGSTSKPGIDNSVNDVRSVFGSDTRQVSYYTRTDGYATSIPNVNASQGYYEFDIDVDGNYSTSSRGVGRVVAWIYGINNNAYGYGDYAVCDFTDDHYATFQEFNNLGQFLPKFDAEQKITGKKWSLPNTAYAA